MDELWDVTDKDGRSTGLTFQRGAPDWPKGMFHVVAGTCAFRPDGTVLLTQRAASKDFPLAWEFPAGSALAGESSREAAVRELAEEAGLVVDMEDLALVGRFVDSAALFDVYVVRVSGREPLKLDPAGVADYEWVTVAEAERRFRSGLMSGPWTVGLSALWDPFVQALGQDRQTLPAREASPNPS